MALNIPAPGISYFTPGQNPPAGSAFTNNESTPTLFRPLTIRGLTMQNRIVVSMNSALRMHINANAKQSGISNVPIFLF